MLAVQSSFRVARAARPVLFPGAKSTRGRRVVRVKALLGLSEVADLVSNSATHLTHLNLLHTVADTAAVTTEVAKEATSQAAGSGPFDFLATGFEQFLTFLDDRLEAANVPYSYGYAIIILTCLVKLATFPLTQKQVQSTVALQALQPRVKELQAKYSSEPETLQLETAKLYRDAGVNPLAGCLPTLATIPVFIGLYRALTLAAQDGLLTQGFYWIPSLAGPVSIADRDGGSGLSWLFPLVDGRPPLGWEETIAYLVLPILLVISQYVSQKIISPQSNNDPSQQSAQTILKFLPLMIGWFSLNVPSGLTLYWFINNLLSTGQQVYLKRTTKITIPDLPAAAGPSVGTIIKPKEERVKQVTGKDIGSRKKKSDEVEEGEVIEAVVMSSNGTNNSSSRKGRKGEKFRARQAREAAAQAAAVAEKPQEQPPKDS